MANDQSNDKKLQALIQILELPDRAYESAKRRYEDLGEWFKREESLLAGGDPHIFVQGSFALGTAIRPLKAGEEYDLDLSCKIRNGVYRMTHSQRQLKDLVGAELECYRRARSIEEQLESKHRCWRLNYRDELRFHMDVVPGIPAEQTRRDQLTLLIEQRGVAHRLAADIAADAIWITDDRRPNFGYVDPDWLSSNPEGYVRWFVSRMEGIRHGLKAEAQVDDLPVYRRKTPLQRVIQLLKRHRDVMFERTPDLKPISIILTTIAGQAYVPGESLTQSMATVLAALQDFRRSHSDVVVNPVNPAENFADRWKAPECRHLRLKEHFHEWVVQACVDFEYLMQQRDPHAIQERAESRFRVRPSEGALAMVGNASAAATANSSGARHVLIQSPPKPWNHSS